MSDALPDYPHDWIARPIDLIASRITSGGTPTSGSSRYYVEQGGLPFAKTEDLTRARSKFIDNCELAVSAVALKETAAKRYPAGTIFISMYGTIGLTKIAAMDMAANQALCALIPPFDCCPDYLYHHLDYIRPQWLKHSGQTTQANINGAAVRAHEVPLPGVNEQRKIALVLDTLDTAIHETEAIIAKLKAVKQGLLHDLLTCGIDANGELRPPRAEASHLYKESPLGWIPKEWRLNTLHEIAADDSPITYGVVQPGPEVEGGVPFIRGGDVLGGRILVEQLRTISQRISNGYRRTQLRGGELLMSLVGYPGEVGVVPTELAGANIARQAALIRLADPKMVSYVMHYLSSIGGKRQVLGQSLGSAQQVVNLTDLRAVLIPLPLLDEADEITRRLEVIRDRLDEEFVELGKLRALKTGIMDDLLTGRVRVTPLLDD